MRRLLTAALIAAALTSGCASTRPAADGPKSPAAAASPSAEVDHSPGSFSFAHPFTRRPEWVASDYWAQDHPVLFVGVVVPAAVVTGVAVYILSLIPRGFT